MDASNFYENSDMTAPEEVAPRPTSVAAEAIYDHPTSRQAEEQPDSTAGEDAANGEPVTLAAIAQEDAATAQELGDFMRENGLPEAQAGKLADLHQKASDRASRKFWGNPEQWAQEVDGDPVITQSLPAVRALVRESQEGKEFAKFLAKARLDGHPTVLRFLARMAQGRGQSGRYL